jgi:hypothetical protein
LRSGTSHLITPLSTSTAAIKPVNAFE